jgi:hypothetical protein
MKKALLTGIVALFLATGMAHVMDINEYTTQELKEECNRNQHDACMELDRRKAMSRGDCQGYLELGKEVYDACRERVKKPPARVSVEVPAQYRGSWCASRPSGSYHYRCRKATGEDSILITRKDLYLDEPDKALSDCTAIVIKRTVKGHRIYIWLAQMNRPTSIYGSTLVVTFE